MLIFGVFCVSLWCLIITNRCKICHNKSFSYLLDTYSAKWYLFKKLELGKIHAAIPWEELSACLPDQNLDRGAPRWFSNQGMLAMMFLKHYLNLNDKHLIELFNTDWSLQVFCGRVLREGEQIRDKNLPSSIRCYLAQHADLSELQSVLLNYWRGDIENTHVLLMDATCYESYRGRTHSLSN